MRLLSVCGFVIYLLAVSAADYQATAFELSEMMRHGRACHTDYGCNVDYAFLAVTQDPEDTYAAAIAELFEYICYSLEILFLWYMLQLVFDLLSMVMWK